MRILLADDDPRICTVLRLWLEKRRHQVQQAPDGQQAWDMLRTQPFDVLITDVNMPRLDGAELVRKLQGQAQPLRLIIILSSRCDLAHLRRQFPDPRVHCRAKPFSPADLAELIDRLAAPQENPA